LSMAARTALILCVDDYENIVIGWKMLLEQEGYEVITATDWAKALQLFASHEVDEVILDYQMPEMSGDSIALRMKELKPDVPILLLSGDRSLAVDTMTSIDDFLFKNDSVTDFLTTVGALLNRSRATLAKPTQTAEKASKRTHSAEPARAV